MPSFALQWESLLAFAVIIILSALSNWLEQRKKAARKSHPSTSPASPQGSQPHGPAPAPAESAPAPVPERELSWEETLRRLLEGEPPTAKPAPPPVIAPSRIPQAAAGPAAPATRTTKPSAAKTQPRADEPVAPLPLPRGTHFPPTAEALDQEEAPAFELARMEESTQAYKRASSLPDLAAIRMQQVIARTEKPVPDAATARHESHAPDTARLRSLLRDPRSARQAVVAAVLLGPPRSLEP